MNQKQDKVRLGIIVLKGAAKTLKTTTLFKLIELLGQSAATCNETDVQVLLQYKKHSIVITTSGDKVTEMVCNVNYMKAHPCDIAITASRRSTMILRKIKDYAEYCGLDIDYSEQTGNEDVDEKAKEILKKIDKIIGEVSSKD